MAHLVVAVRHYFHSASCFRLQNLAQLKINFFYDISVVVVAVLPGAPPGVAGPKALPDVTTTPRAHRFPWDTGSMYRKDLWASRERMRP